MATVFDECPQCGLTHRTTADRLACDARHGRRRPDFAGVYNPVVMCALCGATGDLDIVLDHMQYVESHREVSTGCLIRFVADAPGL